MSTQHWSSRVSFIITTSAFAVGLGNIWRFPYVAGEGGGGAFLLVYLVLVLLVGIPILVVEIGMGRMAQTTMLTGYGKLSRIRAWNGIGWLGLFGTFLIMCFYVMIMAWVVIYGYACLQGDLSNLPAAELPDKFREVASNQAVVFLVIAGILLAGIYIVSRGLQSGLEKYSRYMMISLVVIILAFAIWAASLPGAMEGYAWFLTPDFSKINFQVVISALGQLFFSIGVGMGVGFVFGSYTSRKDNLISSAAWIVFMDTLIAIIGGLMLFPIIFSFGFSPDSGPNLVFVTMSAVFSQIAYGNILGAVFFLLLFLAGFTTMISSIQAIQDSLADRFHISSRKILPLIGLLIFTGSVPVVFSYADVPLRIFGIRVFDFVDFLSNHMILPIGGLLVVIFGGWVVGIQKLFDHLELGGKPIRYPLFWRILIQWLIPISVVIIFINGVT